VDRNRLLAHVERVLNGLRTGNAGRPVFSESLFQWIEDAWVVASVDWGAVRLRSGFLLAQLVLRPGKYTSETYPELEGISKEELRSSLEDALAPGVETEGSRPAPRSSRAGARARGPRRAAAAPGPVPESRASRAGRPRRCRSSPPTSPSGRATGSSTRSSAGIARCGRSSTSWPAGGRTTPSSSVSRASERPRWWK